MGIGEWDVSAGHPGKQMLRLSQGSVWFAGDRGRRKEEAIPCGSELLSFFPAHPTASSRGILWGRGCLGPLPSSYLVPGWGHPKISQVLAQKLRAHSSQPEGDLHLTRRKDSLEPHQT